MSPAETCRRAGRRGRRRRQRPAAARGPRPVQDVRRRDRARRRPPPARARARSTRWSGQNGSGKSTLIKLISGVYRADPGARSSSTATTSDRRSTPAACTTTGLAFVHQDLGLVHDLTVRENVRVGRTRHQPLDAPHRQGRRPRRRADAPSSSSACRSTPRPRVAALTPSERVAVAVARALQERAEGSGVIVFDESSRAIPHEALPAFYDMVRFLAEPGHVGAVRQPRPQGGPRRSATGSPRCATAGSSRPACRRPSWTRPP